MGIPQIIQVIGYHQYWKTSLIWGTVKLFRETTISYHLVASHSHNILISHYGPLVTLSHY